MISPSRPSTGSLCSVIKKALLTLSVCILLSSYRKVVMTGLSAGQEFGDTSTATEQPLRTMTSSSFGFSGYSKTMSEEHEVAATPKTQKLKIKEQTININNNTSGIKTPRAVALQESDFFKQKKRNGVIILGMHRSGTSLLAGLFHKGLGYHAGKPLMEGTESNEKGYFELWSVVWQNNEFMRATGVSWSQNVIKYDTEKVWDKWWKSSQRPQHGGTARNQGRIIEFKSGTNALAVLNNADDVPWIQKDPRMCITLRTWLPLLSTEPAIVFTYRHPISVAKSLVTREKDFTLTRGLLLWIQYNTLAIRNSAGLCRVFSSNDAIVADALSEVQRISDEVTQKCNVRAPPKQLSKADVDEFVDPKLQHNKSGKEEDQRWSKPFFNTKERKILVDYGNNCIVHDYDSELEAGSPLRKTELEVYLMAMKIYCDLQFGDAYRDDYKWPDGI